MTIKLNAPYAIYASGASVDLDNATEAALVAQGRAVYTSNPGSVFFPMTPKEIQDQRDFAPNLQALVSVAGIPSSTLRVKAAARNASAVLTVTFPVRPSIVAVTNVAGTVTYAASWGGGSTINVTGLTNGTSYAFRVVATFASGSVASDAANSVTPRAFLVPALSPMFWLDGQSITGFADGANIPALTDFSGNGWTLTGAGTAAARIYGQTAAHPTYVAAAATLNGRPAVGFSGAAGASSQHFMTNLLPADIGASCTIFIVANLAAAQNASTRYDMGLLDNTAQQSTRTTSFLRVRTAYSNTAATKGAAAGNAINVLNNENENTTATVNLPPAGAIAAASGFIASITLPGTLYLNGAKWDTAGANAVGTNVLQGYWQPNYTKNNNPINSLAYFVIGTDVANSQSRNFGGQIAQIVIFDRVLTQAERWSVEAALASLYNITVVQQ